MFNKNRHMNVFEHYHSADSLPIENNISRGFAIILESYPLVLDRFIDYINAKCSESGEALSVQKPTTVEEFDVGFQQKISQIALDYSGLSSVIGITLTVDLPDGIFDVDGDEDANNSNNLIPDIVVICGDAAILVEVKRSNEDAKKQLRDQVASLEAELEKGDGDQPIRTARLTGSWEEIISVLQGAAALLRESRYGVLSQYLKHLELRYQGWFPVKKLTEVEFVQENSGFIDKRIESLAQNACLNSDDEAKSQWGGWVIPVNVSYIGGVRISADYPRKAVEVALWLGDTKRQGWEYFNLVGVDLSWVYDTSLNIEGTKFAIVTRPYVRFAHFQKTVFQCYLNPEYCRRHLGNDKDKWLSIWKQLSWKWTRDKIWNDKGEWEGLEDLLTYQLEGIIDSKDFQQQFAEKFIETKRKYVDVVLGFETTITISVDDIKNVEVAGSIVERNDDRLAMLVRSIIEGMIKKVSETT